VANHSDLTRKEQVLHRLAGGDWVDGPELANEQVGGSEGLRRLRELRTEGAVIEERKHPDSGRDIFQYRLVAPAPPAPIPYAACTTCGSVKAIDMLSSKYGKAQRVGEIRGKALYEARCITCDKDKKSGMQSIWKEQE
jgi:hypothetical protein